MNRTLGITLAMIATLAVTSTVAAQEAPAPPDPSPADPAPVENGAITMELIDQTFDLAPNGTIQLQYRLIGDLDTVAELAPATTTTTTTTVPGADAAEPVEPEPEPVELSALVLNYAALDEPDQLIGLVGPDPRFSSLPPVIDGVAIPIRSSIEVLSPTEAVLDLAVLTDTDISVSERLEFNDDGIHPIVVQLRAGEQVVARHGTVVERRSGSPDTPPAIDLSLLGATDDPGLNGTADEYAAAVDEFSGLVDDASVLDAGVTMAIPPSVVDAAVESGAVDPSEPDFLADDVILAEPATPFDVSSAVAVGRVDAFIRQLRVGETEVAAAIGETPSRDIWATTTELSGPAAQALRDLGVRFLAMPPDVYRTTIAGSRDAAIPAIDRFIPLSLPDGTEIPVLVLDEELGAEFTDAATAEIVAAMTPTEWSIETIAELRLGQYAAPADQRQDERSHLIATPGLGSFEPLLIGRLQEISTNTEAIRFTLASNLTSSTSTVVTETDLRLPEVAGPSLELRLLRIGEVGAEVLNVASMLPQGDARIADWAQLLDSFVSTAVDDETANAELDRILAETQEIRDGVVAPDPFTFTLTGREGEINVRVGNELSEPVDVVVRVSSPRLDFPDGDVMVTLAPDDVTAVSVPVIARSNGTSPVTVEILTPSLDPLTDPVTLTSRFTALTGLGPVLTGGFLLILLTWWFSHWRSRRRALKGLDEHSADTGTSEPAAE